jgi:hypothetical protein
MSIFAIWKRVLEANIWFFERLPAVMRSHVMALEIAAAHSTTVVMWRMRDSAAFAAGQSRRVSGSHAYSIHEKMKYADDLMRTRHFSLCAARPDLAIMNRRAIAAEAQENAAATAMTAPAHMAQATALVHDESVPAPAIQLLTMFDTVSIFLSCALFCREYIILCAFSGNARLIYGKIGAIVFQVAAIRKCSAK